MSKKVNIVTDQESKHTSSGEFNIEFSPWKVKVTSKGFTPEDFGKMMKKTLGWRHSLFWIIIIMLIIGIVFSIFKPEIIKFFASG